LPLFCVNSAPAGDDHPISGSGHVNSGSWKTRSAGILAIMDRTVTLGALLATPMKLHLLPAIAVVFCGAVVPSFADALPPAAPTLKMLEAITDWTPLFDGKSLAGWKGEGYAVEDGAILCTPKGSFLQTEKEYADFVLDLEFQLAPGANNGIGLRYPGSGDAAYTGMEIQVLDDKHDKYKGLQKWQFHGSVYGVQPSTQAEVNRLKPAGEWNRQQILCIGDHVKVILNGETITDVYLTGKKPLHDTPHPGLERKTGTIAFCGHGDRVAFRKVKIKDFPPASPVLGGNPDNTAPAGFTAIFNGKDLTNWKGLLEGPNDQPGNRAKLSPEKHAEEQKKADERMRKNWTVADGALVFSGNGDSLCTAEKYGDFDFYVDWKIPANADSGIYLRGLPQVQIWDPANPSQFELGNKKGSGGFWNNKGPGKDGKDPLVKADKPIGEWNTFHIRMIGDRATIYLNGQLVVNNSILENLWEQGKPIPRAEQIELQDHGNNLWFKNIYVRPLPY
jgi:Domain of Unknown Function (DUF1080)